MVTATDDLSHHCEQSAVVVVEERVPGIRVLLHVVGHAI